MAHFVVLNCEISARGEDVLQAGVHGGVSFSSLRPNLLKPELTQQVSEFIRGLIEGSAKFDTA